jgi:pilus assembly protein Flp/PilA
MTLAADLARQLRVLLRRAIRGAKEAMTMARMLRDFLADESGATAIEYALIAAGIALAIITAVQGVGTKLSGRFATISTSPK